MHNRPARRETHYKHVIALTKLNEQHEVMHVNAGTKPECRKPPVCARERARAGESERARTREREHVGEKERAREGARERKSVLWYMRQSKAGTKPECLVN